VRPAVAGAEPTPPKPRSRGLYILPNAFTTANLFAGFYAIVQAMNGRFEAAAVAIFVAMVLDSLDGRVARLTNTQSAFGEQYDSMSDMVSFGAAPALIVYEWSLRGMGKLGWLAAFVYVAGAALRLARFNTNIGVVDKRFFQGLPSPAAAALVAGLVWIATDLRETRWIDSTGPDLRWLAWAVTVLQLQGREPAQVRAVHGRAADRARLRAGVVRSADRAVLAVPRLRGLGLRDLGPALALRPALRRAAPAALRPAELTRPPSGR
jgi:CDP-diacylglycerol--serine O-phosphatidyltransferase